MNSTQKKWPFVFITVLLLLVNFGAGLSGAYLGLKIFTPTISQEKTTKTQVINEQSAIIDTVEKTKDAIISVIISKDVPVFKEYYSNPFEDFNPFGFNFNIPQREQIGTEKQQIGAGSGFIVTADGLIITNRHVVEDETASYSVIMNNGDIIDAKIIDTDPTYDIAVLQIDKKNLTYLNLGDSDTIKVGQSVIAIGNALGEFSNTVSSGIVSGLGRTVTAGSGYGQVETLNNIIQTDASINPGNSGGPLLDLNGNVIGVDVAMAQNAENIGFAIPINPVKSILTSIQENGEIIRPYLGIRYTPINKTIQEANNLPYDYGALILRGQSPEDLAVIPGGPADKAGLQENDLILEINNIKIEATHPLQSEIVKYDVGATVTLKVYSKGAEKEVPVILEKNPM
ncbi:MAG: 2-alkenal reductase, 2-alkenal reductase [Candidatus Peregrinibacteria bacterium GW2011_GWE2_39_6]|nr:MAG: 2-alkenal reductase, 2-alkenal reductase [Candidatus Peregrinibacteria bacterium GW2011_GWF2_39_17]KKR25415.1 MAG: 2-alkenal reductase, 2-alkenal reductase [Candidatus Peregrinibacteria bacterium GW2011_GWE2_39_6]HCW32659.1 hypothetical protein [Candidatus Peregrinibacteria bacterium]